MSVTVRVGVRVNISTNGIGRWAASSGDHSKFGVSITELLRMAEQLDENSADGSLELLHFHLGSQVADIQTLKQAVREISQVYVQLRKRGVPVKYLDVGGGLGVNYESGFAGRDDSINYTLVEYANSVVYAIKEVCEAEGMEVPTIVSESGRALTAHHSMLVVEVLEAYRRDEVEASFEPEGNDDGVVHDLYDALVRARGASETASPLSTLLEAYHDSVEKRKQAHALFSLGYLEIDQKALADRLYWSTCRAIHDQIVDTEDETIPAELSVLDDHLVDQYLCDFSVFQSILDHWAIGQRFPIMPLDRLNERPTRRGVLVDLTCDSDGKVSRYVSTGEEKNFLEVHALRKGEPYYVCFFLMGAYQDIMGDMHNLFGRITEAHVYFDADEPGSFYIEKLIPGATIQEMLALVQYFPNDLHRRMNSIIRQKVEEGVIRPKTGVELLDSYDRVFEQQTYFNPGTQVDRHGA
jgi:arginine decarboxylase